MNVYLSFDIEIWCDGWENLDSNFPKNFQRYVFGRSEYGDYALPKTLEILNRHDLKGVFFVEPLFAARFGIKYLETIVRLIRDAGQEIQLHIHPEWTDEIVPPIIKCDTLTKRQHLCYYSLEEQTALISFAKNLLESANSGSIIAFRAGSFAANGNTFEALKRNGIRYDSSLNRCYPISAPELRQQNEFTSPFAIGEVISFPITVFKDGFGIERPLQVGACSMGEMRNVLLDALRVGINDLVIISHNFEMLKPSTSEPDLIVVKRFENLCKFLSNNRDLFSVVSYTQSNYTHNSIHELPKASIACTLGRNAEQITRRLKTFFHAK